MLIKQMGTSEEKTPFKPSKPASSAQDIPPTPYPDWSNSMQAYYGGGGNPNHFFPPPVGSPSPHPYMWGAQHHHMMPPYGTPVPYPAMYPPGAVYAHPGMPMPPASGQINKETAKDQASGGKKPKGNLKRKGEGGGEKAPSGSGNDNVSQSDESVTAGSSDENDNQQEQGSSRKPSFGQMLADASSQSNNTGEMQGAMVPMKPVAPGTNLNIGMDLWSSQAVVAVKDERELKRQKRKQSNRESARRSRLRKQAECEQLQQRVESLTNENQSLRDELQRISGECEKLKTENNTIQDELLRVHGPEAVANLEENATGSKDGEANS